MVAADASSSGKQDVSGNILLLTEDTYQSTGSCHSFLTQSPSMTRDVLGVAIDASPDSLLRHWQLSNKQPLFDNYGFVDIDDSIRATESTAKPDGGTTPGYTIRIVDSPGNLSAIGTQLTDILSEWDTNENKLVVCVYTLTTLLNHVAISTVYQFITILTRQLQARNATAHYHLDPRNVDPQHLDVLTDLFDTTIDQTAANHG